METAESPTPDDVLAIVHRLATTVSGRLQQHRQQQNLFTYDGTLLDQLALYLVQATWRHSDYTILASTRPCMRPQLQASVHEFCSRRSLPLLDYNADCLLDAGGTRFVSTKCDNVSESIKEYFGDAGGLLVVAALLNDWGRTQFDELQSRVRIFSPTAFRELKHQKTWQTLFLFDGFGALDVLLAYCWFISPNFTSDLVPSCYLTCYNESQLDRLRYLITHQKAALCDVVAQARLKPNDAGL